MTYTIKGDVDVVRNLTSLRQTNTRAFNLAPWQATTDYLTDDIVQQNNALYKRLLTGTSGASFDSTEESMWILFGLSGNGVLPAWTTGNYYDVAEVVTNEGRIYRNTTAHTSTTFAADRANWTVVATISGGSPWTPSTYYYADDIVIQGNVPYKKIASGLSGAAFDAAEQALWNVVGETSVVTAWATATYYEAGEQVLAEGRTYMCVLTHTSLATFDLDRGDWGVVRALAIDDWQATTYYYAGESVYAQGNMWERNTSGTSAATFALDITNWTVKVVGVDIVAWAPTTFYEAGQLLTQAGRIIQRISTGTSGATYNATEAADYNLIQTAPITAWVASTYYYANEILVNGNRTLRRTANGTSAATFTNVEATDWTLVTNDTVGSFIATNYYYASEKIVANGSLWQRNTSGISGATFDATEQLQWTQLGSSGIPAWSANTPYAINAVVTQNNMILQRIAAGTSAATFTLVELATWNVIANYVATPNWATTTVYAVGKEVLNEGRTYECITAHTSTTFNADRANWRVSKALGLTDWVAATYYYQFDMVINNGVTYRRSAAAGTSGATFDVTELANWKVVAEYNTPVGLASQAIDSAYTVLATDGELRIAQTAPRTITLPSTLPDGKEIGFSGTVSSTNILTFAAGAGTTIVDPATNTTGANFTTSTWINAAPFSFRAVKVNTVWYIRI